MNLNQSITQIITSTCTIVGILVMMLSISWEMTLISLIILPISAFIVKSIVGKSQKYFKKQQDYLGHVNGQVEEIYSGLNIVKVFNSEERANKEFKKQIMNYIILDGNLNFIRINVSCYEFCC